MKHLFAKKLHSYTLLALMGVFFLLNSYSHAQAYTETFKATGWQSLTQNDLEAARLAALDDALQKAVSLAVMAHRPETLTGPKSQMMMANVLSRRNELIESYRVVSEEAAQARYRMTVTADIRIDQLTALLKNPTVSEPVSPPAIHTKIAIFIHENRPGPGAPSKERRRCFGRSTETGRVYRRLAEQLIDDFRHDRCVYADTPFRPPGRCFGSSAPSR